MLSASVRIYHDLFESVEKPWLYSAPWWLDAVCGEKAWEAVVHYGENGKPQAALPYHFTRIRGLSAVITPPFTQWVSMITPEKSLNTFHTSLLHALPASSILDLSILPDPDFLLQDSLFPVNLKYSFIIPKSLDLAQVQSRYNEGLRRNLREAEKNYTLIESEDISGFLSLCKVSYEQRKIKPPAWLDTVVPRVYKALKHHQNGLLSLASWKGKVIAGVLIAWDHETGYYLAGGRTADDDGASAHALLLDHAVQKAIQKGLSFDFEGSMHPGIANFFQSFGAIPHSYWQIRKFRGLGKLWSILR